MFWKKKKEDSTPQDSTNEELTWDQQATQALEQSVAQAPVPAPLKGKVKKELKSAAEDHARQQGHTSVTPEDLMQGMLAKMPAGMRAKVENAMQQGPEGMEKLKNEFEDENK